jgi:multidrug efflux pump subunit AcrB
MLRFNLSEWALRNRTLVVYAMVVLAAIGIFSYKHLGQSEDPPFTFKVMVVRTLWPGATAEEVAQQVTDRVEKAVMTTGQYEFIRSYSRPGESRRTSLNSGTRSARKSATSARRYPKGSSGRSSTTSSATPSATSTRLPARASTTR